MIAAALRLPDPLDLLEFVKGSLRQRRQATVLLHQHFRRRLSRQRRQQFLVVRVLQRSHPSALLAPESNTVRAPMEQGPTTR